MDAGAMENEISHLRGRASSHHKRIGAIEVRTGNIESDLAVTKRDVEEVKGDVKELRKLMELEGERNRTSNNRVVAALIGFTVTIAGSAITVALTTGGPHP